MGAVEQLRQEGELLLVGTKDWFQELGVSQGGDRLKCTTRAQPMDHNKVLVAARPGSK